MNIQNNTINFKGIRKMPENTMDNTTKKYVQNAVSKFTKEGERMIPENGQYTPVASYIEIKGTQNGARIAVEHDPKNPKFQRVLNIGVVKKGTDRIFSRYTVSGTKKEILKYLNSKDAPDEIYKHIMELSKEVDEYYE